MLNWLKRHFRKEKEKPRIFLGAILVAPRSTLQKCLEQGIWPDFIWPDNGNFEDELRAELADLFSLPPACRRDSSRESDFGLDIVVPDFSKGGAFLVPTGWLALPVFWRPKVTVAARLVHIESGQTSLICKATETLPWKRVGRGLFLSKLMSDAERAELKILLYKACTKVLTDIKKHLE